MELYGKGEQEGTMENHIYTPAQVLELNMQAGEKKVVLPVIRCILLGMMAGAFIAFGAATSSATVHHIANQGVAKALAGAIFPVGLMMIVLVGGELFTGDCLMIAGVMDKRFGVGKMVKVLAMVWISNLIGAVIIAGLTAYSGLFDYSNGGLGAFMIKTAYGKCTIALMKAVCSGILCNIIVCCAVLMATVAKDAAGKIAAIFFPIMAFVIGGWEHCVANMFYIPAGIFAAMSDNYVAQAEELYGLSVQQISSHVNVAGFLANVIPVTIGNILGGMVFVALPLYVIHKQKKL